VTEDRASAFAELGAATLGESGGCPMAPRIRSVWRGASVSGPAYPVTCSPGDNLAIHVAVADAPRGSVLVVNVGDVRECGYWGEVLTTAAQARGIAGLVIDGGARDVAALERLGFPVFAALIALQGATKEQPGSVRAPNVVGDVDVALGDWIIGDADGVTVVPHGATDDVLAAGRARAEKERELFGRLRAGSTTLELLELDARSITGAVLQPGDDR
jgi:4-hydroxy-4-methyl-2-oxoglutarate aldolase